jgi:hypothetical protein
MQASETTSLIGRFPEFFDSSMLATFKSCPEKFRLSYIEHWKSREENVHLHAGGAFAKGLEVTRRAFYTGDIIEPKWVTVAKGDFEAKKLEWTSRQSNGSVHADDAIGYGLAALIAYYGDFECPEDSAKSASRMAGAFEYYWSNYPLSHEDSSPITFAGGKRGIEFSFAHPIDVVHPVTVNPILYVGRMDAIIETLGGKFICDEKTTSSLGSSWSRQWDLRSQFTGYAWGCGQSGIQVDGAIVRGVSILKTKYDTQQAMSYRPEWQIERWYDELLEWIEDIKINWQRVYIDHNGDPVSQEQRTRQTFRHNLDHSCAEYGGCGFREACLSQNKQPWLETSFERKFWNPLLREEKPL